MRGNILETENQQAKIIDVTFREDENTTTDKTAEEQKLIGLNNSCVCRANCRANLKIVVDK